MTFFVVFVSQLLLAIVTQVDSISENDTSFVHQMASNPQYELVDANTTDSVETSADKYILQSIDRITSFYNTIFVTMGLLIGIVTIAIPVLGA